MPSTRTVLPLLACLSSIAGASPSVFTGGFDIWNIPDNSTWIRSFTTTLVLPKAPSPEGGMSTWAGLITTNGDFIQALALSYAPDIQATWGECANLPNGDWCLVSSTLVEATNDHQTDGTGNAIAPPGSNMTSQYTYNDQTHQYDQTTYFNGKNISFLSTASGHAFRLTANTECNSNPTCGTMPAFSWHDTTITLDAPLTTFGDGLTLVSGASGSFSSSDGGKTWIAPEIHIPTLTLPQQEGSANVPSPGKVSGNAPNSISSSGTPSSTLKFPSNLPSSSPRSSPSKTPGSTPNSTPNSSPNNAVAGNSPGKPAAQNIPSTPTPCNRPGGTPRGRHGHRGRPPV